MMNFSNSTWLSLVILTCAGFGTVAADLPAPILTLDGSGYVVFRPDGKQLVGSVPGNTWRPTDVKVWELPSGKAVSLMKGHVSNIWQMSFTPDGKRLATNENWAVKTWEMETGKELLSFATPAFTRCVLFVPDGKHLVTGHDDGRVILWDAKTKKRLRVLKGHTDWVTGLVLSPDGKQIATASVDMTAKIWDLAQGKAIRTFEGHRWYLNRVAFDPKRKRLVTTSDDMTARIWSIETGKPLYELRGHTDWVVPVAISPDGRWIVTGSRDTTVKFWDASNGREILTLAGHTEAVGCVTFSPNGQTLVTADNSKSIKIWDVKSLVASK